MSLRRRGALWIAAFLLWVQAPLFALLLPPTPGGLGFWADLSMAFGFAGTAILGGQFLLTARIRRATAPYGIDIIYYFHRRLAVVGMLLVLFHPLILFVDNPPLLYLLNPVEAPWHMVAGLGSLAAMAVLIASSVWRRLLHLPYDGWRLSHGLLAIGALALAVIHIDGVGYYSAGPWPHAVGTATILAWVAVVIYVRLIKPWRSLRMPYRVVEVVRERGDSWTIAIEPENHSGIRFEPGQFAWLSLGSSPLALHEHPFSISSSPARLPRLEFTIKELGDFTRTIGSVHVGAPAYVDAPHGAFSVDRHPAPGYVFVSGGIGIAPVVSMLRSLADRGDRRPLILILANSRWERITLREAVYALRDRLDLKIVSVLEEPPPGWTGEVGYVTPALLDRTLPPESRAFHYFVCGPTPMIAAVEMALAARGVPLSRFHSELYDFV